MGRCRSSVLLGAVATAAVAWSMMLPTAVYAQAGTPQPPAAQPEPLADTSSADDIVVTGIRQSLATSIDQKRRATQIVDTITAEDIGKLPDENIAESIQRITGVQITRDRGEGLGVNIRGLSAQTTINGRVGLGSRTDGISARDFDFRNLAADFFQTIEVFKSPIAAQAEGALGGTVNLITRKPLDLKERTISLGGEVQYGDYADKFDPRASIFLADQFAGDTLGVALSASYSRRRLRSDFFQSLGGWQRLNVNTNTGFDFNNDRVTTDVLRPVDLRFRTANDTRTRYGVDGTVQWKPSDAFEVRLDGTYTRFENVIRNAFFRTLSNNQASFVPGSLRVDENGSLLGANYTNQQVEVDGRYEPEPIDSYTFGGNAKWRGDRLSLELDGNLSQTKRKLISQFLRFVGTTPANVRYDFDGNDRPPTVQLTTAAGAPYDLTTPSLFVPNLAQDRVIASDAKEYVIRGDLKYEADAGPLRALAAGVRATWRDIGFRVRTSANQATNRANPSFYDQATGRRLTAADDPISQFNSEFPLSDGVFERFGGSFPRSWLVQSYPEGDIDFGSPQFLNLLRIRQFGGLINSNQEQSDISEDTLAGYAMADLGGNIGGLEFTGNAGVRYVKTDLTSSGLITIAGVASPVTITNDYDDWLPAANLTFNLSKDVLLRFAGARVIERPDLGQLSTGFNINISSGVATSGNPLLSPFRADQFDVSLEWYTSREGLISIAGFYKDVSNFVANRTFTGPIPGVTRLDGGTDFLITAPVNGGGATIKGFEVGVQQPFDFLPNSLRGFGAVLNYTFSDANTDSGQPIPRLSKHQVNLIGYFERDGLSTRVAYNYRSRYALNGEGGNSTQAIGLYEYILAQGFLDATISYDFGSNVTVVAEGANLLSTKDVRVNDISSRLRDLVVNDRRFTLGVRVKF